MKAVVLLSGGVDSTVLLAACLAGGMAVTPVTFDYDQINRNREVAAARAVAHHYGLTAQVVEIPSVFASSALLGDTAIPISHADAPDDTTVPARNLVMLALGTSIAVMYDAAAVFIGANLDDAAGYLDCRPKFIQAFDNAASLGTGTVSVRAPYLSYSKQQIIAEGAELGAPLHLTWSCYRGGETPCGNCGACQLAGDP